MGTIFIITFSYQLRHFKMRALGPCVAHHRMAIYKVMRKRTWIGVGLDCIDS